MYKTTTLEALNVPDDADCIWTVADIAGSSQYQISGKSIEVVFTTVGRHYLRVDCQGTSSSSTSSLAVATSDAYVGSGVGLGEGGLGEGGKTSLSTAWQTSEYFIVIAKYVRRELRELSELDRERFLSALEVVYRVPQGEGTKLYGKKYRSIAFLVREHLEVHPAAIYPNSHIPRAPYPNSRRSPRRSRMK